MGWLPLAIAPTGGTTWDLSSVVHGTLDAGHLVFTTDNVANGGVFSLSTISGIQKIYTEFVIGSHFITSNTIQMGIVNSSWTAGDPFINVATAAGVKEDNNLVGYNGNNALVDAGPVVFGDVISIAIDFGNSNIWARRNGGNWNNDVIGNQNPALNIGGISFSGLGTPVKIGASLLNVTINDAITARFSTSSWGFSAPAGFSQLT